MICLQQAGRTPGDKYLLEDPELQADSG